MTVPGYNEVMDDFFKRLSRREFPASVQQFEHLLSNMPYGKDTQKVNKVLNYWFVPN